MDNTTDNLVRHNNKPWLKTYERFDLQYDIELPAHNTSLIDVIEHGFAQFCDLNAYSCMGTDLTFDEVDEASLKVAVYLQSLGLQAGDKVAVMMPNILQLPVTVIGILRAGLTLVNVNPLYTSRELAHQLKDSDAKVLFVLENFAKTYADINIDLVDHVVITKMGDMMGLVKGLMINTAVRHVKKMVPAYDIKSTQSFKDILRRFSISRYKRPKDLTLSDVAVLQYTGGTTGVAKGAMLTHKNLIANLIQCNTFLGRVFDKFEHSKEQPVIITALPLYHIFSFMICMMFGLYRGAMCSLVPNPRDGKSLIKAYKQHPPAFFPAVNTLFNALANSEAFKKLDHSKLEVSMGGGMAVLKDTAVKWQGVTGSVITQGYGLSETAPVATANSFKETEFTGTIGIPLPGTEVAILDDAGHEVDLGERGEISVRGPQVMKGYWNREDATAQVMTDDHYFRTGDIGVMDDNGYVTIVDRKKDMILVSGFNVYPSEIESAISEHPSVLECAVIGVDDDKSGEVPKIFVVKSDPSLTQDEVLEFSKQGLTSYKRPRMVEFVDELPKSNVGKILRKDLRKMEMTKRHQ